MKLLEQELKKLKSEQSGPVKRAAIMSHTVLGYPDFRRSEEIALAMVRGGARFLELQIPFSDPIADGPTIMAANEAALRGGATTAKCLQSAARIAAKTGAPVLLMTYFNIVFSYRGGLKQFCRDARNAGVEGLIVPDVPPEEKQEGYWDITRDCGLCPVPFVSPVTSESRIASVSKVAKSGFLYCISRTGTTGAKSSLETNLGPYLKKMRRRFNLPFAVGFGVSTPQHVKEIGKLAEIAIVGSATLDVIGASKEPLAAVERFIRALSGKKSVASATP